MTSRQAVHDRLRNIKYYLREATDRPWKRGIGNESRKIFAVNKGGLLAECYNGWDGYVMAYAPQELEYLMEVVDELYDVLDKIAAEDNIQHMRSLALNALGSDLEDK